MELGLEREDYELFVKDAMQNCIVVGGACKNGCVFCSCKAQTAACRKNWTNYISEADLRSVVDFIDPTQTIYFGEGPSFLSCEPFQHPEYIKLLQVLNEYFPNTKKITTTIGKNIDPKWYSALESCGIKFIVSVNTFDFATRKEVMKSKDDITGLKRLLSEHSNLIEKISLMHYGDVDILNKDLDILYNINPDYLYKKEILLRMTDYSIYHNEQTKQLYEDGKKTWNEAVKLFDNRTTYPSYWLTSLSDFPEDVKKNEIYYNIHYARNMFKMKINAVVKDSERILIEKEDLGFLLSESVYDYFVQEYPDLNAIRVPNLTFKGSYKVSGLLTKHDIMNAVLKHDAYKLYACSVNIFNKFNRDLHGNHVLYDYPIKLVMA